MKALGGICFFSTGLCVELCPVDTAKRMMDRVVMRRLADAFGMYFVGTFVAIHRSLGAAVIRKSLVVVAEIRISLVAVEIRKS